MRLDFFIAKSRLVKTRSTAKEACNKGAIIVNGTTAKASKEVYIGDIIEVNSNIVYRKIKVLALPQKNFKRNNASTLYEIIKEHSKEKF